MLNLQPDDVAGKAFSVGILSLTFYVILAIINLFITVQEKFYSTTVVVFCGSIAVHYFARRNKKYFDAD